MSYIKRPAIAAILLSGCLIAGTLAAHARSHFTVRELKNPCRLSSAAAIQLGGWAVDTLASQYVPDIAELMSAGEPTSRHLEKSDLQLRLRICTVAKRNLRFSEVVAYDRRDRRVDLLPVGSRSSNVPLAETSRGYIGMYLLQLTPARKKSSGAKYGGWVLAVSPLGPAYNAGVRKGDVVTEVGRTSIRTQDDADSVLGPNSSVTGPVTLTVMRAGKRLRIYVKPIPDPLEKAYRAPDWSRMKKAARGSSLYIWQDFLSVEAVPQSFRPAKIGVKLK